MTNFQSFQDDAQHNKPTRQHPSSTKVYNKKDYEQLSGFPINKKPAPSTESTHLDYGELSQERSDTESDFFASASSVDYPNSISSGTSTGSTTPSHVNYISSSSEMEDNHKHQSRPSVDRQLPNNHNVHQRHDLQDMMNDKLNASPIKDDNIEGKESEARTRAKAKPRTTDDSTALPKFGSWDTKNPSSGESYTLIFRRLRDEKKSGALAAPTTMQITHPTEEETVEPLRMESEEFESRHSKDRSKKCNPRGKGRAKTGHGAAHMGPMRWFQCCRPTVLDD
ncbi:hypothetical protein KP509_22G062300 [Ceratopteris richardii]|uniref:RIN4 pathogenic type III effector avirulence factor Avr cleavage site domain-containing protein n=1 Tax=Ceratopteris richardii TaxID=49495 RepID=A0A8T2S932_CERRI|nr:hypothetical protein KP509_22G062300 [Ceratopteris richardii]